MEETTGCIAAEKDGEKEEVCYCTGNLCNGSGSVTASVLALFAPLIVYRMI